MGLWLKSNEFLSCFGTAPGRVPYVYFNEVGIWFKVVGYVLKFGGYEVELSHIHT